MDVAGQRTQKATPLSRGVTGARVALRWRSSPVPPFFISFFTAQTSTEEAAQLVTACPPFLFFFSLVFFWQQAPGSHLCPAPLRRLLKHSRPPSRNGQNLPPVSVLFFFIIIEWCRGFLRKMASVFFHSAATVRRELPLIGSACSHGNGRGSISVPRGRTQWACVCVCEQLGANRAGPLYLPVCGGKHKRMTSAMKEPRVYGGCMSW